MNYKLSKYIILVEVKEDVFIIFSTRTTKQVLLFKESYQKILNGEFKSLNKDIFETLISSYILVPESENELLTIIEENNLSNKHTTALYQVIMPSANCQLGCGYCGQKHDKKQLDISYYTKLIERLDYKLKSGSFESLSIAWFGGEPLMALNSLCDLSFKLQKLAKENEVKYISKIVTNGLSLKKNVFLDLVKNHKVKSFEITLDGTEEFHDKRRFLKSGEKSFQIIFNNLKDIFTLKEFDDLNVNLSIRCNVDVQNYHGVLPLIKLMSENNFQEKISGFYVAPIHSWGNDAHLQALEKEVFSQNEIDWLIEQFHYGFRPNILPNRIYQVCMATTPSSELIDANGSIYNCTEVSYVPSYGSKYLLGNIQHIDPTIEIKNRPFEDWNQLVMENKSNSPCHSCIMMPVCGGACPKSWEEGNIACPSAKYNISDRVALNYYIQEHGIERITSKE